MAQAAETAPQTGQGSAYRTDEEILGIDWSDTGPTGPDRVGAGEDSSNVDTGAEGSEEIPRPGRAGTQDDNRTEADAGPSAPRPGGPREAAPAHAAAPEWLKPLLAEHETGPALQSLWDQHQAYREIFPTVAEARALKELFPGSADDARQLLARGDEFDRIDQAYFSGDPRAQGQLAEHLLRNNPRAFQAMLRQSAEALAARDPRAFEDLVSRVRPEAQHSAPLQDAGLKPGATPADAELRRQREELARERSAIEQERQEFRASQYAAFEQSVNEAIVRQVRQSIQETASKALPTTVAEGARKRIAEDIFNEINATLQKDVSLTQRVGSLLRQWRFDDETKQQVLNLTVSRAKALVPATAKRIIADWTTSVLAASRARSEKETAAAKRVDITGAGAMEPRPKRPVTPKDIDYSKMSDDQILSMP